MPVVVIIGRPNVGKSSLLNRLARRRVSIVDPRAGITRDRVSGVIEYEERYFEVVDTGGVGIVDDDQLEEHVEQQIRYAIERADVVVFIVDVRAGISPLDRRVAELLRRLQVPIILVANKVDADSLAPAAAESELFDAPAVLPGGRSGYLRYPVVSRQARKELASSEVNRGIMPGYPKSLASLPGFTDRVMNCGQRFPGADALVERLLTLPTHSRLTESDLSALRRWLART